MGGLECLLIVAIVGGAILVNYYLVTRQEREYARRGIVRQPPVVDWSLLNDERVQAALDSGNKIEAIKVFRELTGLGLKEAKDAIEYAQANPDAVNEKKRRAAYDTMDAGIRDMIAEGRIDEAIEVYQKFAGVDEYTAMDAVAEIEHDLRQGDDAEAPDMDDRIRNLVLEGKKIEAIKLYCEMTGLGLKAAKDAVEGMARGG